jgi:hypothetical protein
VLVAGGQTMCLLLTLLAVPVFYSLFDDVKDMPLLQRVFRRGTGTRRRSADAIPEPGQLEAGDGA